MARIIEPWRLRLQPASFNGVPFKVDTGAKQSGRRNALHEFPKRDVPYCEDMGRRARRFTVSAYVIGADYTTLRDNLIAQLETEGPGILIHPTLGEDRVNVDQYTVTERRERARYAEIEITFIEAGEAVFTTPVLDTQSIVQSQAAAAIPAFVDSAAGINEPGAKTVIQL